MRTEIREKAAEGIANGYENKDDDIEPSRCEAQDLVDHGQHGESVWTKGRVLIKLYYQRRSIV